MNTSTDTTLKARRDVIVDAHIHAEASTHDIAAALATFRHPRYEVPAFGAIADGPEAVEGLLGQLLGAFPDFWLDRIATITPTTLSSSNASSAAPIADPGQASRQQANPCPSRLPAFSASMARTSHAKRSISTTPPSSSN